VTGVHRTLVAALAAGLVLLSTACGGSGASEADLLLVSTRDGEYAIFGIDSDGGSRRRLTDADIEPSSPQGLFFQAEPTWSADGRTIAFTSKRGGTFDVYAMDADGTGTRRLTSTREDDGHPTWSPDGRRIAFARGTASRLFVMRADGSEARRITDDAAEEGEPAWSPDGRWIAYVRRTSGTSIRELWLVRPDGTGRRALTKLGAVSHTPAWSPDGRRIAFATNVDSDQHDVYTIGLGSTRPQRVTMTPDDSFEPAWSPDGRTIAYSEAGAIWAIDVETDEERKLTDSENNDSSPVWRPRNARQGG
jgi:Tol biopolymer transport system component